jgi:hypothetical protein
LTLNAFDTIKDTLHITEILPFYGVEVKRANPAAWASSSRSERPAKALCPIHNEKTPSFTVYPSSNSWHCFGCGVGGSVIDFIMVYYGLGPLEAAKRLDNDFNLGLFDKLSQEEIHRISEQRTKKQAEKGLSSAFEAFIDKAYILLCDYLHLLNDWKDMYAPKHTRPPGRRSENARGSIEDMNKQINPLFVEACHQPDYIEYLIDSLFHADIDEKISFYQTHRREMFNIANRIRLHADSGKTH